MSGKMIVPEHLKKSEEHEQSGRKNLSENQEHLIRAKRRTRANVSSRSIQPAKPVKISKVTCGARFGHLTVLEQTEERKNGYVVWRCRCDCGNEYGAASRELKSGRAVSCKDPSCKYYTEAMKKRYSREDFTGRRFGRLLVLGPALSDIGTESTDSVSSAASLSSETSEFPAIPEELENACSETMGGEDPRENPGIGTSRANIGRLVQSRIKRDANGRVLWNCKCDCGNTVEATSSELKSGNRKSCGCLSRPPLYDWVGKRFGRLTVTAYDGKRNGYHYWKCLCDCGNETVVVQTSLLRGHTSSCGCLGRSLKDRRTLVDGTCVEILRSALLKGTIPQNNSSGVRGVYWQKKQQRWIAQIMFKGKMIYLGSYNTIGEAAIARKRGEQKYFGEFLEEYDARAAEEGLRISSMM